MLEIYGNYWKPTNQEVKNPLEEAKDEFFGFKENERWGKADFVLTF